MDIIKTSCRDAREPDPDLIGKCERVICDVPCSGLGILAKKPDMRYREYGSDERLIATQRAILEAAAQYLKPSGILVYSTCTVISRENEENVSAFLSENNGYELVSSRTLLPHKDLASRSVWVKLKDFWALRWKYKLAYRESYFLTFFRHGWASIRGKYLPHSRSVWKTRNS